MAYTTIDDSSAYFFTQLYTGNGSADHAITNSALEDMQGDLVWIKNREQTDTHCIFDSSRGATKLLDSATTAQESTDADTLDSFLSDGFQVDADVKVNTNAETYVAWQWACNGGTTANNTTGDIESTVQVNTTAGFSMVRYQGNGEDNQSIGHTLGVAPEVIIIKKYSETDSWMVFHHNLTSGSEIKLDTTGAQADDASNATWGDNHPGNISSTVFEVGYAGDANAGSADHIAYCFKSIQGYSKFGKYVGTAGDSQFIHTGFKPAFYLEKGSSVSSQWYIYDNKRNPHNIRKKVLFPDSNAGESSYSNGPSFFSNGVQVNGAINDDGDTIIYMAFAEQPFVTSEGVPCTAA